jgi:hypothetical protein
MVHEPHRNPRRTRRKSSDRRREMGAGTVTRGSGEARLPALVHVGVLSHQRRSMSITADGRVRDISSSPVKQTDTAMSRSPAKGGHRARRKPHGLVAACWR